MLFRTSRTRPANTITCPLSRFVSIKSGKEKSSTTRRLCLEQPSIAIIEDIEAIGAFGHPYVSDFVDISYIVNLCRLDKFDAHRILRQLDDAGSVVFEVTVAYLLSQSI